MDVQEFCTVMRRWAAAFAAPNPGSDLTEDQLKTITCPLLLFAGNTPDEVHHTSAAEAVHCLVPHAELRPSAWTPAEWAVIGQHDHTFVGSHPCSAHITRYWFITGAVVFTGAKEAPSPR
jgi:hypothetical protein